ncbi:hypothetical protein DMENIID0001_129150 [Sergentomyia squamirostris]
MVCALRSYRKLPAIVAPPAPTLQLLTHSQQRPSASGANDPLESDMAATSSSKTRSSVDCSVSSGCAQPSNLTPPPPWSVTSTTHGCLTPSCARQHAAESSNSHCSMEGGIMG